MASRKEQKEKLRAERLEREREAAAGARRKRLVGYGAGGALALAALVAIVVVVTAGGGDGDGGGGGGGYPGGGSVPPQQQTDLRRAAAAAGCQVRTFPEEGREHTEDTVQYRTNPPTSGNHNPVPADDDPGIYSTAPPTGRLVHALEHGRVEIQFRPDVPGSVRADLKALYDEDPPGVILTPNETGMKPQVAATAWLNSLTCPRMNDRVFDAIRAFKEAHRGRGPEPVPF